MVKLLDPNKKKCWCSL